MSTHPFQKEGIHSGVSNLADVNID